MDQSDNKQNLQLSLHYARKDSISYWYLYLKKNDGDSLLLDQFNRKFTPHYIGRLYGDLSKQVLLGDWIKKEQSVWITLYTFGQIYLVEYEFTNGREFNRNKYWIGQDFRGSYENFGDPYFYSKIHIFNNDLYLSASYCGIVHFDISKKVPTEIRFFNSASKAEFYGSINSPNQYNYHEKIILTIRENGIQTLYESKNDPYESNLKSVRIYEKEELQTREGVKKIEKLIMEVLSIYGSNKNIQIKLLGYLQEVRNEDITCFFYQEKNSNQVKIIRYSNNGYKWYLGNYNEIEINN